MITIEFPTNGTSQIVVYKGSILFLTVARKFYFGSKIKGEFFQEEKKIAIVSIFFSRIKIIFQEFDCCIKVYKNRLFSTNFKIDNDEIKIVENPLYFLHSKFYSKIYWNNQLVGTVEMQKILDFKGVTLKLKFNTTDDKIQYYSIISYLTTCLNINI
ncbi:hypothetical protein [Flavobacterium sp.]|uniref:hypothetical protein n=1 Tax=Flavobacterium sp. TaxID=239 RepID=UPI00286E7247|nr:hypothetical protein [Flavobacterium sp.]